MMYGLYLSASGALANSYRTDVFANNLANSQTPAFKPHTPMLTQRAPETIEDQLGPMHSDRMLERLGGGVFGGIQRTNFTVGALNRTNRDLDLAFEAKNQFLMVEGDGPNGQTQQFLTRQGKLSINSNGELVTQTGERVLNPSGSAIRAQAGETLKVDFAGNINNHVGERRGVLQIVEVDDLQSLKKQGDSLFAFENTPKRVANPVIQPGHLEGSAVDPISAMMDLISATKSMTGNARMVTHQDRLLDQTINTFGRLS